MNFDLYIIVILILSCVYRHTMMEINVGDIKLQKNVLKFGYRINYEYVSTLSNSFDRFYMVTKFKLPKVQDLQFMTMPYDKGCNHLDVAKSKGRYPLDLIEEVKEKCVKITRHKAYCKKQIEYYNQMAYKIQTNELALILPIFRELDRQKRVILTSLTTGFIVLAYECISSFLIIEDKSFTQSSSFY